MGKVRKNATNSFLLNLQKNNYVLLEKLEREKDTVIKFKGSKTGHNIGTVRIDNNGNVFEGKG